MGCDVAERSPAAAATFDRAAAVLGYDVLALQRAEGPEEKLRETEFSCRTSAARSWPPWFRRIFRGRRLPALAR